MLLCYLWFDCETHTYPKTLLIWNLFQYFYLKKLYVRMKCLDVPKGISNQIELLKLVEEFHVWSLIIVTTMIIVCLQM